MALAATLACTVLISTHFQRRFAYLSDPLLPTQLSTAPFLHLILRWPITVGVVGTPNELRPHPSSGLWWRLNQRHRKVESKAGTRGPERKRLGEEEVAPVPPATGDLPLVMAWAAAVEVDTTSQMDTEATVEEEERGPTTATGAGEDTVTTLGMGWEARMWGEPPTTAIATMATGINQAWRSRKHIKRI